MDSALKGAPIADFCNTIGLDLQILRTRQIEDHYAENFSVNSKLFMPGSCMVDAKLSWDHFGWWNCCKKLNKKLNKIVIRKNIYHLLQSNTTQSFQVMQIWI